MSTSSPSSTSWTWASASLDAAVGREAEVHRDRRGVGDDVARDAAVDADRGQSLAVGAAVDVDVARLIARQPVEHRTELVNGVVAQPRSRGVRPGARGPDDDADGALAARLDVAAGRLAEDGDVGAQPVGQFALDAAEPVGAGLDLLAVVHHQRDVVRGFGDGGGQVQEHRVARLHVGGAAAVQFAADEPARQVVGGGHGVGVAGQQHPRRPAEVGAGQHRVAVADDLEARRPARAAPPRSRRRCAARAATRWGCPPAPRSARSDQRASPGPRVDRG